jgi:opacity protein-like surface antigen
MSILSKMAAGSVIVATAALGGATLALADGSAPKKVAYERPADWSGVYFGVGSGYQWSSIDVHGPAAPAGFGISSDHDETFVAAHIGVQHQWGALVLGIEAGWMSTIRDRDGNSEFCNNGPLGAQAALTNSVLAAGGNFCSARLQDIWTIGGRAGWALGHWMPYLTGGYANAGVDFAERSPTPGALGTAGATILQEQAHDRLPGWYLGGGFEWTISPGWTTGIEYRHYEFDTRHTTAYSSCSSVNTTGCNSGALGLPLENVRFSDTTDTIELRVSWRWGREQAAAPLK